MPIEGYNPNTHPFTGIEVDGQTAEGTNGDSRLHLSAGDNVEINIDNGVVVISVPAIPAEDITGKLTKDRIESVDAATVEGEFSDDMKREITKEVVDTLPVAPQAVKDAFADVIAGIVGSSQDAADSIADMIAAAIVAASQSLKDDLAAALAALIASSQNITDIIRDALIANNSISFEKLIPSCLSQNSSIPTTYTPNGFGLSLLAGSTITVPPGKTALVFASISTRRVLGTHDLFTVTNGARFRDIAVNVHGNDLDPRTHFTGFFVDLIDDNVPTDYALGIKVEGNDASAIVDAYSLLIMWFGGAN